MKPQRRVVIKNKNNSKIDQKIDYNVDNFCTTYNYDYS
jgi:hypothetical protein